VNANPASRKVGLARALSKLGYCSRSQAAEQISAGRVRLNGIVSTDAETPVRLGKDKLEVDGKVVAQIAPAYWMLNKPRGVVTTASDEKNRRTVYDYLNNQTRWLAPVGRLDKASEGLLLFTNDSEWAAAVLAPETHVSKTYHVQIAGQPHTQLVTRLVSGIKAKEEILRAKTARVLRQGGRNTWLEIILDEGKNRQIRRMLDALDVKVLRLVRVAIGSLTLGELPKGSVRELTTDEKRGLDVLLGASRHSHGTVTTKPSHSLSPRRR
jgi:23S rRNA pseudouridine2605 synthase